MVLAPTTCSILQPPSYIRCQDLPPGQLLVADEKVNLAVMMQPKQAPGDLLAGASPWRKSAGPRPPGTCLGGKLRLGVDLSGWSQADQLRNRCISG